MTIQGSLILLLLAISAPAKLLAETSIPIQRIDVANLLTTGAVSSPVMLAFENGGSTPCITSLLAYQETTTIWAGAGQACLSAIASVTITPMDSSSNIGVIYQTPENPVLVDKTRYSTRLLISQNMAPVFNSINGAMISQGTIQIGKSSQ